MKENWTDTEHAIARLVIACYRTGRAWLDLDPGNPGNEIAVAPHGLDGRAYHLVAAADIEGINQLRQRIESRPEEKQ